MEISKLLLSVLASFLLVSCSGGNGDPDREAEESLKATIGLVGLPLTFTYDDNDVPNGYPEFEWAISFDTNNSGEIDKGDLSFSISLAAFDSSPTQTISRDELEAKVMEYVFEGGVISSQIATIGIEVTDQSITFLSDTISIVTADNLEEKIKSISNGTQVNVQTTYRDPETGHYYYDFYPEQSEYTRGLDTTDLIDTVNDLEILPGTTDLVFNFIDIESITIEVN
jgi:uncharacterized protein YcfL